MNIIITYKMKLVNMKKILLSSIFICLFVYGFCQTKDERAIKHLLEKESATWRLGDIKSHADCCHIRPYSRILVSTGDSTVLDISPDIMINPPANIIGRHVNKLKL